MSKTVRNSVIVFIKSNRKSYALHRLSPHLALPYAYS